MRNRSWQIGTCVLFLAFTACNAVNQPASSSFVPTVNPPIGASASRSVCEDRSNDTTAKLEACIKRDSLWSQLAEFQRIAEVNPGPLGHPSRDTGTPGYLASAKHVAALMRRAGYRVTIQTYTYHKLDIVGTPQLSVDGLALRFGRDWFVARLSGSGSAAAALELPAASNDGCRSRDFTGFTRGNAVLLKRGACGDDLQVKNAQDAGASAVILYDSEASAHEARLVDRAAVPVAGTLSAAIGNVLAQRCRAGKIPKIRIALRQRERSGADYNVIADSPYGDRRHTVVVDAHLDAIYGAGMLDNASGSTTILEIALDLEKTQTRNRLRYIWFGGEEIGLEGSRYYTAHLTTAELRAIAFDVDVDVTATPNYDYTIANPADASKAKEFPPNVIPDSTLGNRYFADYYNRNRIPFRSYRFGNDGTDSLSFSFAGVPNTGILTQQDCCKHAWETNLWGGYRGNYEGKIPSFNGGCVDYPNRWCDNLDNNDPAVLEQASRATAYVVFQLANYRGF